jgi:hypothetical protein
MFIDLHRTRKIGQRIARLAAELHVQYVGTGRFVQSAMTAKMRSPKHTLNQGFSARLNALTRIFAKARLGFRRRINPGFAGQFICRTENRRQIPQHVHALP